MIIKTENKFDLESSMRITLLTAIAAFSLLYYFIMNLINRTSVLEKRIEDIAYDD